MADYYCDSTGNDTTGDGSAGTPWATIQKAIDNATGGDTVWVGDTSSHVLSSAINFTLFGATTATTILVIRGWDQSAGAGADGIGDIDGNSAVANIFTVMPRHVVLYNLKLHDTTDDVIATDLYTFVHDCELYNGGQAGADLGANCEIVNCHVHDNGDIGIESTNYTRILNCYVVENTGMGIRSDGIETTICGNIVVAGSGTTWLIYSSSERNTISNNVVDGAGKQAARGISFLNAGDYLHSVYNNIIYDCTDGMYDSGGGLAFYANNQFYNNTTDESLTGSLALDLSSNSTANPAFVDEAGGDYTPGTFVDGYPATIYGSGTTTEIQIGAVQQAGGGGGGLANLINGGLTHA